VPLLPYHVGEGAVDGGVAERGQLGGRDGGFVGLVGLAEEQRTPLLPVEGQDNFCLSTPRSTGEQEGHVPAA